MARGAGCLLLLLAIAAALFLIGRDYVRRHPQDVPWTELDLRDPIGRFTSAKIARLEPAQCRGLLREAGVGDEPSPPRSSGPDCGYEDGMQLAGREGGRSVEYRPAPLVTSCPLAAALGLWEARVVQPAARRHLATSVTAIDHAGSYSCRRLYGRQAGEYSQHATADALDVTGFVLADGKRISVLGDWSAGSVEARFMREVRDGACGIFSTVLSPNYNTAHRDHLHLDVARRGGAWTFCR